MPLLRTYISYYQEARIPLFERAINWDEQVTEKTIDLQKEYNQLNKVLFDGACPRIKMRWSNSKRTAGAVRSKGIKGRPETYQIVDMYISRFAKMTYGSFLSVLAHELIHVFLIATQQRDRDAHGPSFKKEMRRINNMRIGFDEVTITQDMSTVVLADHVKGKRMVVVMFEKPPGSPPNRRFSGQIFSPNTWAKVKNKVQGKISATVGDTYMRRSFVSASIIETDYRELMKYPHSTKFGGVGGYYITDADAAEILQGKVLETYQI